MKLIKFLSLAFIMFLMNIALPAQHLNLTPHEKALVLSLRMQKTLALTDEQQGKVLTAIENSLQKKINAKEKFKGDTTMMKKSMMEIKATYEAEMKQILTPQQYEQYLAKKKEIMDQRRQQHEQKKSKEPKKN